MRTTNGSHTQLPFFHADIVVTVPVFDETFVIDGVTLSISDLKEIASATFGDNRLDRLAWLN